MVPITTQCKMTFVCNDVIGLLKGEDADLTLFKSSKAG